MLYKKRYKKIKRYAREFCDTLRNSEILLTKGINLTDKCPTVKIYRQFGYTADFSDLFDFGEKTKDGELIIDGFYKDGVIEIYGITKSSAETLKAVVRHECLHFMLHKSDLPYEDDDNLFNLLAFIYDASPTALIKNWPAIRERLKNPYGSKNLRYRNRRIGNFRKI